MAGGLPGLNVGEMWVRIRPNTAGFASSAERELGAASSKLSGGQIFKRIGAVGAAGLLAVGVAALKMGGDFQQSMTQLRTGAGESAKNIGMVSNAVLNMAGKVGDSPKALAAGLYMIESAGYHGAQGLQVLKASAEGAKVGMADQATVADALTSALNAYHLPAADAVKITNALIATVSVGKMHMQDLAGSIGKVLPAAAAAHIGIAQIGGAIATMTRQGTDAGMASTYLRQMILQLSNPTAAAATEMKALGLSSIDVSSKLGQRGLTGTLNVLTSAIAQHMGPAGLVVIQTLQKAAGSSSKFHKALASLKPEQQTYIAALAKMVGGTRVMQAALELTGGNAKIFGLNVATISQRMRAGGKDVAGWSLIQKDWNQQIEQAKAYVEALVIRLGGWLIPKLQMVASWVIQLFQHSQLFRDALIGLAATIGGILVAAIATWVTSLFMAGGALAFLISPIGLIVLAIGALVTGLIYAYQHSARFRAEVSALGERLRAFASAAIPVVKAAFASVIAVVGRVVSTLRQVDWGAVFHGILQVVGPVMGGLAALGVAVFALARAALPILAAGFRTAFAVAEKVVPPVLAVMFGLARVLGPVIGVAIRLLAATVSFLAQHLGGLKPVLVPLVAAFVGLLVVNAVRSGILGLASAAGKAVGSIAKLAGSVISLGQKLVQGAIDGGKFILSIGPRLAGAVRNSISVISQAPGKIKAFFMSGSDTLRLKFMYLRDAVQNTVGKIKTAGQAALDFGKKALTAALNIAKQTAAFIAQKAAALAAAVAQKVLAAAQWLLNAAMDANPIGLIVIALAALAAGIYLAYTHFKPFREIVDAVGRAFRAFAGIVLGAVHGVFDWIKGHWPILAAILTGPFAPVVALVLIFRKQILGAVTVVFNWVKEHWPLLLAILTGPIGVAVLLFRSFGPKILSAVSTAFSAVLSFLAAIPGHILSALATLGSLLLSTGTALITGLWHGIQAAWSAGVGFLSGLGGKIVHYLAAAGSWLLEIGRKIIGGLWRGIKAAWSAELFFWTAMPRKILSMLASAASWLVGTGGKIISGLYHGITGFWSGTLAPWINDVRRKVLGFFVTAGKWLWDTGIKILTGLYHGILSIAGTLWGWFTGINGKILGFFAGAAKWLYDIGKKIVEGLIDGAKSVYHKVTDFFGGIKDHITSFFHFSWGPLGVVGVKLIHGLVDASRATFESVARPFFASLAKQVTAAMDPVGQHRATVDLGLDRLVKQLAAVRAPIAATAAMLRAWNLATETARRAALAFGEAIRADSTTLTTYGAALLHAFSASVSRMHAIGEDVAHALAAGIRAGWSQVRQVLDPKALTVSGVQIIAGLLVGLQHGWANLKAAFDIRRLLIATFGTGKTWLVDAGVGVVAGLRDGMQGAWSNVNAWFADMRTRIVGSVGSLAGTLTDKGRLLIAGFGHGMRLIWPSVIGWLGSLAGQIQGAFSGSGGWLAGAGANVMSGFASGIAANSGAAVTAANNVATTVTNTVKAALKVKSPSQVMFAIGGQTVQGLANGLTASTPLLVTAATSVAANLGKSITRMLAALDPTQYVHDATASIIQSLLNSLPDSSKIVSGMASKQAAATRTLASITAKLTTEQGKQTAAVKLHRTYVDQLTVAQGQLRAATVRYYADASRPLPQYTPAGPKGTYTAQQRAQMASDRAVRDSQLRVDRSVFLSARGHVKGDTTGAERANKTATTAHAAIVKLTAAAKAARAQLAQSTDPTAFVNMLTSQTAQLQKFAGNLQTIMGKGMPLLAQELAKLGPAAGGALAAAMVSSPAKAKLAEAALEQANHFAQTFTAALTGAGTGSAATGSFMASAQAMAAQILQANYGTGLTSQVFKPPPAMPTQVSVTPQQSRSSTIAPQAIQESGVTVTGNSFVALDPEHLAAIAAQKVSQQIAMANL